MWHNMLNKQIITILNNLSRIQELHGGLLQVGLSFQQYLVYDYIYYIGCLFNQLSYF